MAKSQNSEVAVLQVEMSNMNTEIKEVKDYLKQIMTKVDALTLAQTEISELRNEVKYLKVEINELKGTNNLKNTMLWVGLVASAIINVVVIYQLFGGSV